MPYELGVTEVGSAEYPLIEVLRETIFGEFGHVSRSTIAEDLEGRRDVLVLIAHLEGNPVGFKVGYGDRPGVFYSKAGGVLRDYRRLGLARRMNDWMVGFARARGYRQISFNTFNHFRDMILFGLSSGFQPVAAEWRAGEGVMSFKFARQLVEGDTATAHPGKAVPPDLTAASLEIDYRDSGGISSAIKAGFELAGMRRDQSTARVILAKR
jgi:GNAT superfamily N-acetyltransferase